MKKKGQAKRNRGKKFKFNDGTQPTKGANKGQAQQDNPFDLKAKTCNKVVDEINGNGTRKQLVDEYRGLSNANTFNDRRFGEKNQKMTQEEKMLARFSKERKVRVFSCRKTD
jgi:hypothetical protein